MAAPPTLYMRILPDWEQSRWTGIPPRNILHATPVKLMVFTLDGCLEYVTRKYCKTANLICSRLLFTGFSTVTLSSVIRPELLPASLSSRSD